jgi:hypothetical protein
MLQLRRLFGGGPILTLNVLVCICAVHVLR